MRRPAALGLGGRGRRRHGSGADDSRGSRAHPPAVSPDPEPSSRPRVGVSACLFGEHVRYDGRHCRDAWLMEDLGAFFDYVPACPEFESGLGAPRETLRLSGESGASALVARRSGADEAPRLLAWSRGRLAGFADLDGYVLKKASPTCGLERVKRYRAGSMFTRDGVGLFAQELQQRLPLLPLEEEGRLRDPGILEQFATRVHARHRWRTFVAGDPAPRDLVAFHARHKYLLLAHGRPGLERTGRLVAAAGVGPFDDVLSGYGVAFQEALVPRPTRGRHADVMLHLLGYAETMEADERRDFLALVDEYRRGLVPLVVPARILRHALRRNEDGDHGWAAEQVWFEPAPPDLRLRTSVVADVVSLPSSADA